MVSPEKSFKVEKLHVQVFGANADMAVAAARFVKKVLDNALIEKDTANLILATGASQFEFLKELQKLEINWKKINVFHLDEYKGISDKHPASFRKYLKDRILDNVNPQSVHFLNGDADDINAELVRYENLLKNHEIDIACIGIGENGHIAFNDPPVADFNDPKLVKVVELDEECRLQQLGEGWFPTLNDVPVEALSLTIPAIIRSKVISCVVPDKRKAKAVFNTLNEPVSTNCPASILRTHKHSVLFLDEASASHIDYPIT